MHFIFMPYGKRSEVELLLRDMEAQKHFLRFYDKKKKETGKGIYIQGQIRILPFGFVEYVAPKEDADLIMNSLDFENVPYGLKFFASIIKRFLRIKKIPKYKKEKKFLWIKDNVSIIPIGIREDLDIFDEKVNAWHEGI